MRKLIAVCVVSGILAVCNTTLLAYTPSHGSAGSTAAAFNEWCRGNSFCSHGDDRVVLNLNAERITVTSLSFGNLEDKNGARNMNFVISSQAGAGYAVIESDLVNWNCGSGKVFCERGFVDGVDCNKAELIRYVNIVPEKLFWLRAEEL
jgi:hypothetical protein